MPCNWSAAASILSKRVHVCKLQHSISSLFRNTDIGPIHRFIHTVTKRRELKPHTITRSSDLPSTLTNAQLSRAACQAVRLCCLAGELRNAFYIVNSLRYNLSQDKEKSKEALYGLRKLVQEFDAIEFGRPVNPRLAYHSLLHGLIRQGLTTKAAQLAELMMEDGFKIRGATLTASVRALTRKFPSTDSSGGFLPFLPPGGAHRSSRVLDLTPSMTSNAYLSHGVRLVQKAQRFRQRRSESVFQFLISACLLQGEIIVGSLLFVLLVKDWEARTALAVRLAEASQLQQETTSSNMDLDEQIRPLRIESSIPSSALMNSLLKSIDEVLSREDSTEEAQIASLQALAYFAMLLDRRQLPFPCISVLIRSLYRCPKYDHLVWIDRGNGPELVNAYSYFHRVLKELINDLPAAPPPINPLRSAHWTSKPLERLCCYQQQLPPLDLPSYNSLLHYALRHRLSPALANKVLGHMTQDRHKPLAPNKTTIHILLRSGTLLRHDGIAKQALQALQERKGRPDQGTLVIPRNAAKNPPTVVVTEKPPSSRFSQAQYRLATEAGINPNSLTVQDTAPRLIADEYTLSTFITHLISTGNPQVIADILFCILPELAVIDHPSWGDLSARTRDKLHSPARGKMLKRAASRGPYLYATILNALQKAGRTGLAERVWILARHAERVSWIKGLSNDVKPWCLPIEAYTSMIQCYAAEARRARSVRHIQSTDMEQWYPSHSAKGYVIGWARFIMARNRLLDRHVPRGIMGRYMGVILAKSMKTAIRRIYRILTGVSEYRDISLKHVQVPRPDARFFNTVLQLFSGYFRTRPGRPRVEGRLRRRLQSRLSQYARLNQIPEKCDPMLLEILEGIIEAGYPVPLGLRHLLIGRSMQASAIHQPGPRILDRRPFAFPRLPTTSPIYALPTHKTRGLPLGRRRPRKLKRSSVNSH